MERKNCNNRCTYETDLKYNIDNKAFNKQKVNAVVNVGGEAYKIVAINPNEVVMSAANDKKLLWVVVVVLLPLIGLILWFFLGPRNRTS